MEFFKFTDGVVELDRKEIALYPNCQEILKRDKTYNKAQAYKEFTYVYFVCDFRAYPTTNGLSAASAHHYAVVHSGLPTQYEPDPTVRQLMEQYKKEHLSIGKKSTATLLRIFGFNDIILEKLEGNINLMLQNAALTKDQISELIAYQKQLLEIATNVPVQVKKLKEAMTLLESEDKEIVIGRGGKEVSLGMQGDDFEDET